MTPKREQYTLQVACLTSLFMGTEICAVLASAICVSSVGRIRKGRLVFQRRKMERSGPFVITREGVDQLILKLCVRHPFSFRVVCSNFRFPFEVPFLNLPCNLKFKSPILKVVWLGISSLFVHYLSEHTSAHPWVTFLRKSRFSTHRPHTHFLLPCFFFLSTFYSYLSSHIRSNNFLPPHFSILSFSL